MAMLALWLLVGFPLGVAVARFDPTWTGSNHEDVAWRGFAIAFVTVMAPVVAGFLVLVGVFWLLGHATSLPDLWSRRRGRADYERIAELEAEIDRLAREQDPS